MADKPFDPTKPVQTRDGRKARILCTDFKGICGLSIVVAVSASSCDHEETGIRYSDGRLLSGEGKITDSDLVNVPEVTTTVSNVYRDSSGRMWSDAVGEGRRFEYMFTYVGFIEWTFEDGEPTSCRFVPDPIHG